MIRRSWTDKDTAILVDAYPDTPTQTIANALERAKAVSDISQTIINTGKLEVEYMKQTGMAGTGFVPQIEDRRDAPGSKHATQTGVSTRTTDGVVHRMRW